MQLNVGDSVGGIYKKSKNNDNRMALGKTMELYLSCYTMEKL